MSQVMACIDGSLSSPAVCDYAAWASLRLGAPLTLLHVLDHKQYPPLSNLSGNIALGSREQLLQELAELDQQRSTLALEQGRLALEAAKQRAQRDGVSNPQLRQRHGDLVTCLGELEQDIRLLAGNLCAPYCGPYVNDEILSWFPTQPVLQSFATIALRHQCEAFGLLVLGSEDSQRFSQDMQTHYLAQMGELVAVALQRVLAAA